VHPRALCCVLSDPKDAIWPHKRKNIWREAEEDEDAYRREVRATLLHELGHYLGLEEIDLEDCGLE